MLLSCYRKDRSEIKLDLCGSEVTVGAWWNLCTGMHCNTRNARMSECYGIDRLKRDEMAAEYDSHERSYKCIHNFSRKPYKEEHRDR